MTISRSSAIEIALGCFFLPLGQFTGGAGRWPTYAHHWARGLTELGHEVRLIPSAMKVFYGAAARFHVVRSVIPFE
ncbi:MAG TPA: hypothetical protein VIY68_13040 [Steroidobacteraceae bacterium]